MVVASKDLWQLALDQQQIDAGELAEALVRQVRSGDLDFRTRLLIRDSLDALTKYWGEPRLLNWLEASPVRRELETIWKEDLGRSGFRFLAEQIVETTKPEEVRQMLHELGDRLGRPVRVDIAGSIALILKRYLDRQTTDMDIVNEVPKQIRDLGSWLEQLQKRYRLEFGHVQSHYLPTGWEQRLHGLEPFGRLRVYLVDAYDVLLSKLFSRREKDRDDLRFAMKLLDKATLARRLKETAELFLADQIMRENAERNWKIVFDGESLPA